MEGLIFVGLPRCKVLEVFDMVDVRDVCLSTLKMDGSLGLDEVEAYVLDKEVITIRIANSQIIESKGIRDRGLAIRVVKDKAIGSAATTVLTSDNLKKSLHDAFASAKVRGPAKHWASLPKPKKFEAVPKLWDEKLAKLTVDETAKIAFRMLDSALGRGDKIADVSGSLNLVRESVSLMNTHGLDVEEKASYILGTVTTEAKEGTSTSSGFSFQSARTLADFNADQVGIEAADMALKSLGARSINEDKYSLILTPAAFGEVLAFVFSPHFVSKSYQDKVSCFYGKLGRKIVDENVTVYDDPRVIGGLGSKSFDDEGVPTRRIPLIEKGVFKKLLYDTFYASKDKVQTTGNALRFGGPIGRSYDPIPFPSPHNMLVKPSDYTVDELIRETRHGILVSRLWYTYPLNPERGDFSTTARSGNFLIEKGEIKYPVRMMRIYDNLPRWLNSVGGIGKKASQVMPWHALPSITPAIKIEKVKATPAA